MLKWVKVFRLPLNLLAGLLVVLGFKLSGQAVIFWLSIAVVVVFSAIMVHNDWRDRFHDSKKGKKLALWQPRKFLFLNVSLWFACLLSIAFAWGQDDRLALLLAMMILSGLLYSEFLRVPMLPNTLVAATSASPLLFPAFLGYGSRQLWLMFFAVAAVIFGREIIKDLEDITIDGGHKWTLPLKLGESKSRKLAAVFILSGQIVVSQVSVSTLWGLPFTALAASRLLGGNSPRITKLFLDLGLAIVCLLLLAG